LTPIDGRPIIYVLARRELVLDGTISNSAIGFNLHIDLINESGIIEWREIMVQQVLDGNIHGIDPVSLEEIAAIRNLSVAKALLLCDVLKNRNGMVVDFNPTSSAVLRSNTAMVMLGNFIIFIILFFFFLKKLII